MLRLSSGNLGKVSRFAVRLLVGVCVVCARPPFTLASVPYLIKDIKPNGFSSPEYMTKVGNRLFFNADDGIHGQELWVSDGTEQGTYMVTDLVPGPDGSVPQMIIDLNGTALFQVDDNVNGMQWYNSDGTSAGTLSVGDVHTDGPGIDYEVCGFWGYESAAVNDIVFYQGENPATGRELWRTDGTPQGTVLVKDILPGPTDSFLQSLDAVGKLLFFAQNSGPTAGYDPWRSDGTTAGTYRLQDMAGAVFFVDVGGVAYFECELPGTGSELCASNGTPQGTRMVKDIYPGQNESTPINLTNVNGTLFFSALSPGFGREVWKSDGTEAGTQMVIDLVPGAGSGGTTQYAALDGLLFFFRRDAVDGWQLWKTNGTGAGTVLVKVIGPPDADSPNYPVAASGKLYFSADDGIHGEELWGSDGTSAGTYMIYDLNPGAASATPESLVVVGSLLFFKATNLVSGGAELFAYDTSQQSIPATSSSGLILLGTGLACAMAIIARSRLKGAKPREGRMI